MRFSEHACILLNKFFPKVQTDGRTSPESYSEAQYNWAKDGLIYFGDYLELKDKEILDAGCGYGGKTIYYAEQGGKHVIGVDLDEKHINYALEYAAKKNFPNVEFKVANLANLPFESDKFDVILLNDVVEHIKRPILIDVLKECKRVLKKGGRIFIEFPPWTSAFAAHLYDYIDIPWCQFLFSTETLSNVTRK
ncbi:class I SAM-dependent methyltransferase, partial [candidate division KSB1 bacterium]|nr:class I SAM-dependent methyltransferase [candidate division KSB1 bacterium]